MKKRNTSVITGSANEGHEGEHRFTSVFMETLRCMDPPLTLPLLLVVRDVVKEALKHAFPGQRITDALMVGIKRMDPPLSRTLLYFMMVFIGQVLKRAQEEART